MPWNLDVVLYFNITQYVFFKPFVSFVSFKTRIFWKTAAPSLTSRFCLKSFKKVVLYKLLSHLQANNLCNPFQAAYRAGHSTETVSLRVENDILSALDNDNISVLLLLDLSAAFDTIDHQILLSRLYSLFLVFSLLHSNGSSHISQTDVSSLQ